MLTLEMAIEFLKNEQQELSFTDDFLVNPEVKSAILQGILDAQGQKPRDIPEAVFNYTLQLSRNDYEKPNQDMPFNTQVRGAQVLIYQQTLQTS